MNAPHTEEFLTLQEIVAAAKRNLPPGPWSYLIGGTETETTVRRNRQALDSLALRQRVLVDVRNIDITTSLLGKKLSSPVFLAPVGGLVGFINPEQGAIPVARAAVAHGTAAFISPAAKPGFEAAAAAVDEPLIFQLYVRADRAWVEDILDRVTKDRRVAKGDVIVTAGTRSAQYPSLFPRGIQIGVVTSVGQSDTSLYKQIQIKPFVDFSSLDAVTALITRKRTPKAP